MRLLGLIILIVIVVAVIKSGDKTADQSAPSAVSSAPAPNSFGDDVGLIPPLRMAAPLRVVLTAHSHSDGAAGG